MHSTSGDCTSLLPGGDLSLGEGAGGHRSGQDGPRYEQEGRRGRDQQHIRGNRQKLKNYELETDKLREIGTVQVKQNHGGEIWGCHKATWWRWCLLFGRRRGHTWCLQLGAGAWG